MRLRLGSAVLTAVLLLLASPSESQITTGSLEGRVLDAQTGEPIPLVNVVIEAPDLQGGVGTISMRGGTFWIPRLQVGNVDVLLKHVGYAELRVTDVAIRLGRTTQLGTLELSPRTIEMPTHTVVGDPVLDAYSSELSVNLTQDEMDALPVERDYRSLVAILPQANASPYGDAINIAGGTGSENMYAIDGVNVTDPYDASSGTRLPHNFIREIEIKSGGYEAEFGRSTGGVINVITRSGTNQLQGEVYGYFTNNDFASDGRRGMLELERDAFERFDVGFNLGGPIQRDRLFYFAAYDPTLSSETLQLEDFGGYDDQIVSHQFAGKLSWRPDERTRLNFTAFGDPSRRDEVAPGMLGFSPVSLANPDPLLAEIESGGTTFALDGHHTVGDRWVFDASISRFTSKTTVSPATERGAREPVLMDEVTKEWSGGYSGLTGEYGATRTAARLKATWFNGRHKAKVGVEFEDVFVDEEMALRTSSGEPGLVQRFEGYYVSGLLETDIESHTRIPTVFVQDSWRVDPRVTLNFGLRWDGLYVEDVNESSHQRISDQFQPRLGFTYQVGRLGSQKFFGSWGRFYEQYPGLPASHLAGTQTLVWTITADDPRGGLEDATVLDVLDQGSSEPRPVVDDLRGQHFDEVTLGYERRLGPALTARARGIHRELREVIEDGFDEDTGMWVNGNPGRGALEELPDPVRRYTALELSAEYAPSSRTLLAGSYVLSRNYGNYPGVIDVGVGLTDPNLGPLYDDPRMFPNSKGLLPNDRTHVFKLYGTRAFDNGLSVGGFFTWQSGAPRSRIVLLEGTFYRGFVTDRGSDGRMPSLWNLDLRFAYDLSRSFAVPPRVRPRLLLDVFHVLSPEVATNVDQVEFLEITEDGTPISANPTFGRAISYQPPMTVRLGVQTLF